MINVQHLSLQLQQQTCLHDINVEISSQGISMIVGANGAGKTLLLKLIANVLKPTKGRIDITLPITDTIERVITPAITWVPQTPVLLDRSVVDNIALPLHRLSKHFINTRVNDALDWANIHDLREQPALSLSTGQQQLVALARAWALQPRLLLLDEPCANLDPSRQQQIERLILQLNANGCKIIMSSHQLSQIQRMANDIIFLASGRLLIHTSTSEFFTMGNAKKTNMNNNAVKQGIREFIHYA